MSLPEHIGRYRVVGHLASGGMADIFLGKLVGPSGFERPVVIKRILPALAKKEAFVEMFLDEARVVARIQHENVVQVFELGEDGDELFLAMEYLQGESALGLLRRAAKAKKPIDPAIGAYVVMKAAAGLDAAHELQTPEGEPLNLVHRDISPSNLFLTYTGGVKVLDFGIAKFEERESQTEAGQVKGKFAYMSPEQCLAEPIDRRSDIFSLGTVLFELTTGRRLFSRETSLLTMKAVCERPIPSPRQVDPHYPAALEAVFRKACARDVDERYKTAAQMRRDIAEALRVIDGPAVPEEALADLMKELFEDRRSEKVEMLRRVQQGSQITNVPEAEVDESIELPIANDHTGAAVTPLASPARRPEKKKNAALPIAVGVAAVALLVGGGLTFWLASTPEEPEVPAAAASPVVEEEPVAEPEPEPEEPAPPSRVALHVDSEPPGAEVRIAGAPRGSTPIDLSLARADEPVSVEVALEGYVTHTAEHVPSADDELEVTLRRAPRARPRGRRGGATPTAPAEPSGSANRFRRFN